MKSLTFQSRKFASISIHSGHCLKLLTFKWTMELHFSYRKGIEFGIWGWNFVKILFKREKN